MRGLAADDAAERDAATVTPGAADEAIGKSKAERQRNLESPRHGDALIFDALRLQLLDGATGELIGDVLVEAGLDDQHRAWALPAHELLPSVALGSRLRWPAILSP